MSSNVTKASLVALARECIATESRTSPSAGAFLAAIVDQCVFHGASPSEFRGFSDSGLNDEDFAEMLDFALPFVFAGRVFAYLDRDAA